MIVVDSSIWIDELRRQENPAVARFRTLVLNNSAAILIGDIILLEVLQGARDDGHAEQVAKRLSKFPVVPMLDADLAARAAAHYRTLRQHGITIRKTADLIIGTYCLQHGHQLLHNDRDFDPMVTRLGLMVA